MTQDIIFSDGDDDDDDSDGWQEVDIDGQSPLSSVLHEQYTCVVCPVSFTDVDAFFQHLTTAHDWIDVFDNRAEAASYFGNQYDWIRFVNYMRRNKPNDFRQAFYDLAWKTDSVEYLYPVKTDDSVLAIDIESLLSSSEYVAPPASANSEDDASILPAKVSRLLQENQALRQQLTSCKRMLSRMAQTQDDDSIKSQSNNSNDSATNFNDHDSEDLAYFSSYGHFEIHGEMLNDRIRTESYRDFILKNAAQYFTGKEVLDVGAGSGILSMFAAEAGAKKVYGVEASEEIFAAAEESVRVNNLDDRITLIRSRAEFVRLPVEKVDVIISEWMGFFLFFESMLDSVLKVASNYLHPDGHIFPRHYTLCLLGVQCSKLLRDRHIEHWNNVYGYKMPSLRRAALCEAHVVNMNQSTSGDTHKQTRPCLILTSEPIRLYALDLKSMHRNGQHEICTKSNPLIFEASFVLRINPNQSTVMESKSDQLCLDALVGYFDVRFDDDASEQIAFSTSPSAAPTHWKQTLFFLDNPVMVRIGDSIEGLMSVRRSKLEDRGLDITLQLDLPTSDKGKLIQNYLLVS